MSPLIRIFSVLLTMCPLTVKQDCSARGLGFQIALERLQGQIAVGVRDVFDLEHLGRDLVEVLSPFFSVPLYSNFLRKLSVWPPTELDDLSSLPRLAGTSQHVRQDLRLLLEALS